MAQEKQRPDRAWIEKKVREVVGANLQVAADEVKDEDNFVYDLGADSLDLTELAAALEEEFGIEIPESEFSRVMTVSRVADYVESQLQ